ncbi:hypothetical protein K466DRAFT_596206 [Polyporus arcularius HHB13444]|uniref:Uncharacterized protein n=1 Tax=Polyporus arcularius HHB13444 TaxID=1314778 RepID=A0A5C3PPS8_9APHY|nr:hypothetical protein K466DRAFT_596206 [Polyporus arcularius HHB13444]
MSSTRTIFQHSFAVPVNSSNVRISRFLLVELQLFDTPHHVCSAQVAWNVLAFPCHPSGSRPPLVPQILEPEGARILLPADSLLHPIFCTFHRLRGGTLPRRVLLIIQFYEFAVAGPPGAREVAATIDVRTLAPAQFTCTSPYVSLEISPMDTVYSDDEDIDEPDDDEMRMLQNGILVETLGTDDEEVCEGHGEGGVYQ